LETSAKAEDRREGKRKKGVALPGRKKSLDPPNRIAALLTVGLSLSFYFIVAFPLFWLSFSFFCFDNILFLTWQSSREGQS
jgi:hypothetical protein